MYKIIWFWFLRCDNIFLLILPTCAAGVMFTSYENVRNLIPCSLFFSAVGFGLYVCLDLKVTSSHVSRLILCMCCYSPLSLPLCLLYTVYISASHLVLWWTFFCFGQVLALFSSFSGSSLFNLPLSLPPSSHAEMGEWTFLRNNAITSMDACLFSCVCVPVCAHVYETHSDCGHRLFLGENMAAAFCFCSCFRLWFVLWMLW